MNKGPIKKGPTPVKNGKPNAKTGKLEPLKNNGRDSPSLRGGGHKVIPEIKDEKGLAKEQAAVMSSILSGKYTALPPKRPTEVRVFLSSTFTDMREERNILMRRANPELKEFCFSEHDLDFSMVDMRWGVTDEATNDHSTEEICLREILNCQRVGIGPTFVTILGDRYGYRPIPTIIDVNEMDGVILPEVTDQAKTALLQKWFKRDDNAVPPRYVLQPVSTYCPGFGQDPDADKKWWAEQEEIGETLRTAIRHATTNGKVTASREHEYNMSVTESEIWEGLVRGKQSESHSLAFIRRFKNLDDAALNEEKTSAKRYIDNMKTQENKVTVDTDIARMRQKLQDELVPKHLSGSNIYKYAPLEWAKKGVTPDDEHKDHQQYVENFCKDFTVGLKTLIIKDKHAMNVLTAKNNYYSNFDEILHHVHFVRAKVETFRGQEDVLTAVKTHIESGKRVPYVLYAESGGGKTSIMAKVFELLPKWFGGDVTRVIRFLGTSPLSTEIYDVLWSVVGQVADNYKKIVQPSCFKTLKGLIAFLPRFLRTLDKDKNEKLVILLDSVDQLSGGNDAFKMRWLPTELPQNVHIIISTLPSLHGILDNCGKIGIPKAAMYEVTPLNETEGKEILSAYLEKANRKIQPEQEKAILKATSNKDVQNVLYLKLLIDKAVTWHSYTKVDLLMKDIGSSVRAAINHLFGTLENKFGKVLISHTLGYLTVGLSGLTNVELEDALSCDNEVLDQVYQYHPPPVDGIIRFPPVLWPRIKYDIEEYLTERNSQGKNTLFWYHRQFIEASQERYITDAVGKKLHRNLAMLFLAENEMRKTITLTSPRIKRTIADADRQIAKHPITSDNRRTLIAAPYHFHNCDETEGFKENIFFNYKFLLAKIQAEGVHSVIEEIAKLLKHMESKSSLVYDYDIEMAKACLLEFENEEKNRGKIRNQIACSVPQVSWLPLSGKLREQAIGELQKTQEKMAVLLPLHPFLFYKANLAEKYEGIADVLAHCDDLLHCLNVPTAKGKAKDLIQVGKRAPLNASKYKTLDVCCMSKTTGSCASYRTGTYYKRDLKMNVYGIVYPIKEDGMIDGAKSSNKNLSMFFYNHDESYVKAPIMAAVYSSQEKLVLFQMGKDHLITIGHENYNEKSKVTFKFSASEKSKAKKSNPDHFHHGIRGAEVEIVHFLHSDVYDKTIIFTESQVENGGYLVTLCASFLRDTQTMLSSAEIPGRICRGKYQLTPDDTAVVFAMKTPEGDTKVYSFDITANKLFTKFIMHPTVKDMSFTSIGPLIWYTLTQSEILGYDTKTGNECFSVAFDSGTSTCLTVEDDGEFIYVGDTSGKIHAWQVDCKHYLGFVQFYYGAIRGIYMSRGDVNVAVHTSENLIFTIPQRNFVDQCVRTLKGQKNPSHNAPSDELDRLGSAEAVHIIEAESLGKVVATFEKTCCTLWKLKSLEKVRSIPYGSECGTLDSCRVLHNNQSVCIVHDDKKALIFFHATNLKMKILPDVTDIVTSVESPVGFWFLTRRDANKLDIKCVEVGQVSVTKMFQIKESLASETFEMFVTASGKYVVLKVKCSDKELEIIESSEKKTNGAAEACGDFKFYAVDVSKSATGEVSLIPCLKNLSKVLCLGKTCVMYQDHTVLILLNKTLNFWDIEAKKNLPRLVKGKNVPMFEHQSRDKPAEHELDIDVKDLAFSDAGQMLASITDRNTFIGQSRHCHTSLDAFKASGEHVTANWWKNKPNNQDDVLDSVVISPDGTYAITTSKSNLLKSWHISGSIKETSSLQLDVKVATIKFDESSQYAVVLGHADKRSKVMVFKLKK